MIFYNMRYRGPYEYDKFILNTLQYHNIINEFINNSEDNKLTSKLNDIYKEIDVLFDKTTSSKGLSEQIYKNFIMNGDE